MENKVLNFDEWKNLSEGKKDKKDDSEEKEEKKEKNPLVDKVADLSTNLSSTVTFDKAKKLEVEDTVWYIVGVTPDKAHRKIKVSYRDKGDDKEKKVDFFDFHTDAQESLYNLLKKNL